MVVGIAPTVAVGTAPTVAVGTAPTVAVGIASEGSEGGADLADAGKLAPGSAGAAGLSTWPLRSAQAPQRGVASGGASEGAQSVTTVLQRAPKRAASLGFAGAGPKTTGAPAAGAAVPCCEL
eukprot:365742-Chlamydomonas_euryale.AAC.16